MWNISGVEQNGWKKGLEVLFDSSGNFCCAHFLWNMCWTRRNTWTCRRNISRWYVQIHIFYLSTSLFIDSAFNRVGRKEKSHLIFIKSLRFQYCSHMESGVCIITRIACSTYINTEETLELMYSRYYLAKITCFCRLERINSFCIKSHTYFEINFCG